MPAVMVFCEAEGPCRDGDDPLCPTLAAWPGIADRDLGQVGLTSILSSAMSVRLSAPMHLGRELALCRLGADW